MLQHINQHSISRELGVSNTKPVEAAIDFLSVALEEKLKSGLPDFQTIVEFKRIQLEQQKFCLEFDFKNRKQASDDDFRNRKLDSDNSIAMRNVDSSDKQRAREYDLTIKEYEIYTAELRALDLEHATLSNQIKLKLEEMGAIGATFPSYLGQKPHNRGNLHGSDGYVPTAQTHVQPPYQEVEDYFRCAQPFSLEPSPTDRENVVNGAQVSSALEQSFTMFDRGLGKVEQDNGLNFLRSDLFSTNCSAEVRKRNRCEPFRDPDLREGIALFVLFGNHTFQNARLWFTTSDTGGNCKIVVNTWAAERMFPCFMLGMDKTKATDLFTEIIATFDETVSQGTFPPSPKEKKCGARLFGIFEESSKACNKRDVWKIYHVQKVLGVFEAVWNEFGADQKEYVICYYEQILNTSLVLKGPRSSSFLDQNYVPVGTKDFQTALHKTTLTAVLTEEWSFVVFFLRSLKAYFTCYETNRLFGDLQIFPNTPHLILGSYVTRTPVN